MVHCSDTLPWRSDNSFAPCWLTFTTGLRNRGSMSTAVVSGRHASNGRENCHEKSTLTPDMSQRHSCDLLREKFTDSRWLSHRKMNLETSCDGNVKFQFQDINILENIFFIFVCFSFLHKIHKS